MSPQNRHNGFGDRWIGLAAYFLYLLLKRIENLVFPERKKEVGETSFLYFRTEHFFDFSYSFSAGSRGKLFVVYRLLLFFFGNNGDLYCYCVRNSAFSFVEHIQLGDGTI